MASERDAPDRLTRGMRAGTLERGTATMRHTECGNKKLLTSLVTGLLVLIPSGGEVFAGPTDSRGKTMTLRLTSPSFSHQGRVPRLHTCEGKDISPALSWTGAPAGTKSFALIVDDPDAPDPEHPRTVWVHWVLYNLPASAIGLGEAVKPDVLPPGTLEGTNDWGRTGYGGPCPPIGRHRYFFKLYALDIVFPDLKKPNKARLESSIQGHILAQTELVGTYKKGD